MSEFVVYGQLWHKNSEKAPNEKTTKLKRLTLTLINSGKKPES